MEQSDEAARPSPERARLRHIVLSREVIDPVNSACWYAMDGLWLGGLAWPAYVATALTLGTGGMLLRLDRRGGRELLFSNLALNAWMWMNAFWLVSDLAAIPALRKVAWVVAVVGLGFIAVAARHSRDARTVLAHFRRLRLGDR